MLKRVAKENRLASRDRSRLPLRRSLRTGGRSAPAKRPSVSRAASRSAASTRSAEATNDASGDRQVRTLAAKRLEDLAKRIRICTKCPLRQSRTLAVPGEGKATARVMIIGEGPGKHEDQTGRPFVGNAGRYLDHVLAGTPFTRADFFITNIVKCRPPSNRTPKTQEIDTCVPLYLAEQIQSIRPKLILLLGSVAVKKMLGLKGVESARGKIIEREGRRYLASYHPAVRFYREDLAQKIKKDFSLLKRELKKL